MENYITGILSGKLCAILVTHIQGRNKLLLEMPGYFFLRGDWLKDGLLGLEERGYVCSV